MIISAVKLAVFLVSVVTSVSITFDVGGRDCGLGFSLVLSGFYTLYGFVLVASQGRTGARQWLAWMVWLSQVVVIPALVIVSLSLLGPHKSVSPSSSLSAPDPVPEGVPGDGDHPLRTVGQSLSTIAAVRALDLIEGWYQLLRIMTPTSQMVEGVLTVVVCRLSRGLLDRSSREPWTIMLLVASAVLFSPAIFLLSRIITTFSGIDQADSILIGAAIACALLLSVWSIVSGKSHPLEASLMFAYITFSIYRIFADHDPNGESSRFLAGHERALPPLPPPVMALYTTLLKALGALPSAILTPFGYFQAAILNVTPVVLLSLAYRLLLVLIVFLFGVDRARLKDRHGPAGWIRTLGHFSPAVVIGAYTSLLIHHFDRHSAESDPAVALDATMALDSHLWAWLSIASTMGLYLIEVQVGSNIDHIKTD